MESIECPRCEGVGTIAQYYHIEDGICFKCRGAKMLLNGKPYGWEHFGAFDAVYSPRAHRWLGRVLVIEVDGDLEVIQIANDPDPAEKVIQVRPDLPLAVALADLVPGDSTEFVGPTAKTVPLKFVDVLR